MKKNVLQKSSRSQLESLRTLTGVQNVMALPKIVRVSLNVGLGANRQNKDMVAYIAGSLEKISGQKSQTTKAKKAISTFMLRQGDEVGLKVTLRGSKMTDFLERLVNVSLPRIRDFKGIDAKSFDNQGNLTLGFKNQVAFVELGHEGLEKPFGVEITIGVKNSSPTLSAQLFKLLGFPMKVS